MSDIERPDGSVTGTLTGGAGLTGALAGERTVSGALTIPAAAAVPAYDGAYTVAPAFGGGTVLATAGKRMTDDVTVEAIALCRVSNLSGGKTVYIGGIFDGE